MSDIIQFNYKDHWLEEEINLERSRSKDKSLGFTIAGGIDMPLINHNFSYIIVTHITENSLVYRDKRLKLNDIILCVNNFDFTNIKHQEATDILRSAGRKIRLLIRRLSPLISESIELEHNGQLGISIGGGIGNQYFENDHGIFIVDINKDQTNKQLDIGDRLLEISSTYNTYDLRFVTHEIAIKCIQSACAESQKIKLYVGHTRGIARVQKKKPVVRPGQYDPYNSKDQDSVQVNENNYSFVSTEDQGIKTEHDNADHEKISGVINGRHADNRNKEKLVVSFDTDDYRKYENRGKGLGNRLFNGRVTNNSKILLAAERERPRTVRFAAAPTVIEFTPDPQVNVDTEKCNDVDQHRNVKVNDSHQNAIIGRRAPQQLKLNETAIREAHEKKLRRQQSKMNQRARRIREDATAGQDRGIRWQVESYIV